MAGSKTISIDGLYIHAYRIDTISEEYKLMNLISFALQFPFDSFYPSNCFFYSVWVGSFNSDTTVAMANILLYQKWCKRPKMYVSIWVSGIIRKQEKENHIGTQVYVAYGISIYIER